MTVSASPKLTTPVSHNSCIRTEAGQIRVLATYTEGSDSYARQAGDAKRKQPPRAALMNILAVSSDHRMFKGKAHLQTQAALWVVGLGPKLGHFGTNGWGLDGKWGDCTRKTLEQYQKSRGLKDLQTARTQLLAEARDILIGEARSQGWQKIEQTLTLRRRSPKDIKAYKEIYREMSGDIEKSADGPNPEFFADQREFKAMSARVIEVHQGKPKYQGEEGKLLRRATLEIINSANSDILAQQLPQRIKIYEAMLEDLKYSSGQDTDYFLRGKRDFCLMASRMHLSHDLILDTLKYFNKQHEG